MAIDDDFDAAELVQLRRLAADGLRDTAFAESMSPGEPAPQPETLARRALCKRLLEELPVGCEPRSSNAMVGVRPGQREMRVVGDSSPVNREGGTMTCPRNRAVFDVGRCRSKTGGQL
jgi:hypothetical protein